MNNFIKVRGMDNPATISYSLLAALVRHLPLDESIRKMEAAGIGSVHYDIADELVTLAPEISHELRNSTSLAFDYHIAMKNPNIALKNVSLKLNDYVCAHSESNVDWRQISSLAHSSGAYFGIGLNVATEWLSVKDLVSLHKPDFVLVMAAEAGRSGGTFDYRTLEKIHNIKSEFPNLRIHVDGGIDDLAAASLRGHGVDLLVSGSYLHSGNEAREKVAYLQGVPDNPKLIELLRNESPSVRNDASWEKVIESIESGHIGCTAVLDDNGKYAGLITDHDIRVHISEGVVPRSIAAIDLCNKKSFTANPEEDYWTLMLKMQNNKAMFTVIPLVDEDFNFSGIIRTQDVLFRSI